MPKFDSNGVVLERMVKELSQLFCNTASPPRFDPLRIQDRSTFRRLAGFSIARKFATERRC